MCSVSDTSGLEVIWWSSMKLPYAGLEKSKKSYEIWPSGSKVWPIGLRSVRPPTSNRVGVIMPHVKWRMQVEGFQKCSVSYPHFGPKKILVQFSLLSLIPFFNSLCFTPQFSTALQLRIFTTAVFNSLACKAIQSVFLALQVIWKFLKQLHIFLHFIPNFRIKSYEKGILVISCSGTHFSPYNLSLSLYNLSVHIINQILSKNHFSIASESVWVILVLRGILVFSH